MEQAQIQRPRSSEQERVLDWRFDVLEAGGYNPVAALALANSPGIDLHRAVGLLSSGCSQDTALRILL
ncbi:MAG: hypothetical protein AABM30_11280 [Actinomycetota bacterium]